MEIALIIVGGLTLISLGGMVFAYLEKKLPQPSQVDPDALGKLAAQVAALEAKLEESDKRTLQLEESARFTAKLLEQSKS